MNGAWKGGRVSPHRADTLSPRVPQPCWYSSFSSKLPLDSSLSGISFKVFAKMSSKPTDQLRDKPDACSRSVATKLAVVLAGERSLDFLQHFPLGNRWIIDTGRFECLKAAVNKKDGLRKAALHRLYRVRQMRRRSGRERVWEPQFCLIRDEEFRHPKVFVFFETSVERSTRQPVRQMQDAPRLTQLDNPSSMNFIHLHLQPRASSFLKWRRRQKKLLRSPNVRSYLISAYLPFYLLEKGVLRGSPDAKKYKHFINYSLDNSFFKMNLCLSNRINYCTNIYTSVLFGCF